MAEDGVAAAHALQASYAKSSGDVDFRDFLRRHRVRSDAQLAEVIEADGRCRINTAREVTLTRYLDAVPDLGERPDALDAALEVALRSLVRSGLTHDESIRSLVSSHPDLETPILEAAALNEAIVSTRGLRESVATPPVERSLPCDFGPTIDGGARRYCLERLLGTGAFGEVYAAVDRKLSESDRPAMVAVKILAGRARSVWDRKRFAEEATKARRVDHPNVARVFDRGVSEDGEDYLVCEYVEGGDLNQWFRLRDHRIHRREAALLVANIARGVQAAHMAGLVHCDLKPGNVLVTASGETKVSDFGIAIRRGDLDAAESYFDDRPFGNLAFISPEQYRREEGALSVPSDIYALGSMFYYLLTGSLPNGDSVEEIARTHDPDEGRTKPPSPRSLRPEVGRDLDLICRRAMAIDPADRYGSAAALADDLDVWARREPIPWTRPGVVRVLGLWISRKPAVAAVSAILVLSLLFGSQQFIRNQTTRSTLRNLGYGFAETLRHGRMDSEVLRNLWWIELTLGPKYLASAEDPNELWGARLEAIDAVIAQADAEGRSHHLEPLFCRSVRAFWHVNSGEYAQGEPQLKSVIEAWSTILAPDDPWLRMLRAVRECADVQRTAAAIAKGRMLDEGEKARLAEIAANVTAVANELLEDDPHTPLEYLFLKTLEQIYAPEMLDDADRAQRLRERRRSRFRYYD